MMETTGYYFDLWEEKRKMSTEEKETLTSWEKKNLEKKINKKAEEIFDTNDKILT